MPFLFRSPFKQVSGPLTVANGGTGASNTSTAQLNLFGPGVQVGNNGLNSGIELGFTDGTTGTPFIDFHVGAVVVDYDARILAANATGVQGGGSLTFSCASGAFFSGSLSCNGQYLFPATQNASANADTLDDYEEGTWTPTLTAATPPTSATISISNNAYTKIGRLVHVMCSFSITSVGSSGAGQVYIGGLPFAAALNTAGPLMCMTQGVDLTASMPLCGFIAGGTASSTQIGIFEPADNASGGYMQYSQLADTDGFFINGTYHV